MKDMCFCPGAIATQSGIYCGNDKKEVADLILHWAWNAK